jgi:hypothetical protein
MLVWIGVVLCANFYKTRALESIKAGKRLAESKFSVLNIAPKGQRSVAGFFGGA